MPGSPRNPHSLTVAVRRRKLQKPGPNQPCEERAQANARAPGQGKPRRPSRGIGMESTRPDEDPPSAHGLGPWRQQVSKARDLHPQLPCPSPALRPGSPLRPPPPPPSLQEPRARSAAPTIGKDKAPGRAPEALQGPTAGTSWDGCGRLAEPRARKGRGGGRKGFWTLKIAGGPIFSRVRLEPTCPETGRARRVWQVPPVPV